jgi:hypothetical protein
MKPTETKKQRQNKGEKEGEKRKGNKKQTEKGLADHLTFVHTINFIQFSCKS